ncbi:hypothetical protein WAK64_06120 [Bacillus spongiae]|uniref:DUF3888 domain-containing protein n=1 Tax=Bacillus spongiae TaxID=2683610 RepID=A0ABU8HBP0_9BACI
MNKAVLSISILSFLILSSFENIPEESKIKTEIIPQNQPPRIMEKAFLRYLGETILNIMNDFGDDQLFTFTRIERITKDTSNDSYDISIRVIGFEGPLNPPYKLIRMTIRIPGENYTNYSVVTYSHRFVSGKEFEKFTKYTED